LCGTTARRSSDEAMRILAANDWPGNVRELRNAVHGIAVLAKGATIEIGDLPDALRQQPTANLPIALHRLPEQGERDLILSSLLALRRDLPEVLTLLRSGGSRAPAVVVDPAAEVVTEAPVTWRDTERDTIQNALAAVGGNRRLAAERLGIPERTFYRKLKSYRIS